MMKGEKTIKVITIAINAVNNVEPKNKKLIKKAATAKAIPTP